MHTSPGTRGSFKETQGREKSYTSDKKVILSSGHRPTHTAKYEEGGPKAAGLSPGHRGAQQGGEGQETRETAHWAARNGSRPLVLGKSDRELLEVSHSR